MSDIVVAHSVPTLSSSRTFKPTDALTTEEEVMQPRKIHAGPAFGRLVVRELVAARAADPDGAVTRKRPGISPLHLAARNGAAVGCQ